jgi:hypothetical protein
MNNGPVVNANANAGNTPSVQVVGNVNVGNNACVVGKNFWLFLIPDGCVMWRL